MSTAGTIGRPVAHDPLQTPETTADPITEPVAAQPRPDEHRTRKMQLIPEALARSHMAERVRVAERERAAHWLAHARRLERRSRRLQRRAERASQRARRALAQAVMQ
jgi:hypothetical protein